ncbi:hypothetical protein IMG5_028550 [Ichthyophthirius multifiliis]|uniref:Uncharacterized protein n=1 Tax=Ichthyophthirius multifiliis TaxID=5932 RepID=G0QLB9_ICHMU|nr:hypothetical protein IMG5_028550 [Ichthyophthirius multifiliis]EGR33985.1 hypothetical protein IMG5_028550 [Ichthyophthirius multifiliis]|eukprot:XP_004039289.1 hypothetical protein IMG5_028550 [Ichthyophthirius multifiliis]
MIRQICLIQFSNQYNKISYFIIAHYFVLTIQNKYIYILEIIHLIKMYIYLIKALPKIIQYKSYIKKWNKIKIKNLKVINKMSKYNQRKLLKRKMKILLEVQLEPKKDQSEKLLKKYNYGDKFMKEDKLILKANKQKLTWIMSLVQLVFQEKLQTIIIYNLEKLNI